MHQMQRSKTTFHRTLVQVTRSNDPMTLYISSKTVTILGAIEALKQGLNVEEKVAFEKLRFIFTLW